MATVVETKETTKGRVDSQMVQAGDVGHVYGGVAIEGKATAKEALVLAGANFEVLQCAARMGDKDRTLIPNLFHTYRDDVSGPGKYLGTVKSDYHIIQNERAFAWVDDLLGSCDECAITSAGVLHGGRYVWLCVDLGGYEVLPGDEIRHHLLIVNSHDGSSNMVFQLLDNRPVCQNVVSVTGGVEGSGEPLKIRHTRLADIRLKDVQQALQVAGGQFKEAEGAIKGMALRKLSVEEQDGLIYKGLGVSPRALKLWSAGKLDKQPQWVNQSKAISGSIERGPGSDYGRGTVYGVLNGFTHYFDHERHVRNSDENPDVAVEQKILRGKGVRGKKLAFDACVDFCSRN
jgi:phage/plasmid-like protein (TIGR03299 family)